VQHQTNGFVVNEKKRDGSGSREKKGSQEKGQFTGEILLYGIISSLINSNL